MTVRAWLLLLLLIATLPALAAEPLRVAAASDLTYVMAELAAGYERQAGTPVRLTFGSSGNFYSQIANGAPFDVFLSADVEYPRRLEQAGLAEAPLVYGRGRLALWARRGGPQVGRGMQGLLDARRIAIANPQHAPYGRAAVAALRHFGVYDRLRDRLVLGENVSQAAQFVESAAAEAGLLALSLALAPPLRAKGDHWVVPEDAHPPLEQAAAVIAKSPRREAARAFLRYLQSDAAREVLRRHGFEVPTIPASQNRARRGPRVPR